MDMARDVEQRAGEVFHNGNVAERNCCRNDLLRQRPHRPHVPDIRLPWRARDRHLGTTVGTHTPTYAIKDLTDRWIADSIARFEKGLEPTKYSYWDRMVNEDCRDGRHAGAGGFSLVDVEDIWKRQKAVADTYKLGLIQYEGGNHNTLGQHLHNDARYMEFYPHCNHTAEDAANYTEMFRRFVTIGGRYPCKFVDFSPVSRFGAWGGLRWMSGTAMDRNPVWDAVVAFNNEGRR